ncbi:MBL fold metallo-hydrolase [Effusibacillus lacus]|uniref:Metallohydrolase n=1 Tax=Effusibacillus lacus TaxID=1348429 RepID=A0A292YFV6_9BACL|nr:MBL fold metallo-hydrolase [Effusibacillus lacus]TCS75147.1 phosphoribosyl 1,2-cyclic phosphodiesterase [Effusibacillus lacus]GAX89097.1 metallohydrolase [Effusibacillus lacus]
MLRFSVLASGSSGNAVYVETENTRILIDAGVACKQIEAAMNEISVSLSELDAILITHEHSDHIKGVGVVARKVAGERRKQGYEQLEVPIYATEGSWQDLHGLLKDYPDQQRKVISVGDKLEFDDLLIEPFPLSHDAREPVGFVFYHGSNKLTLATDLGYMSSRVKETIADSDAYILESNHDINMLRVGPYPWYLKKRILSDKGHLSNEAAGEALIDIMSGYTQDVLLAHLSQENNYPDLAEMTVQGILDAACKQVQLHRTHPNKPTALFEIKPR